MSRSNCRPLRSRRRNDVNRTSMNSTIDLTYEDSLLPHGSPSSISSNETSNSSRNTSHAWELIDLSAEPDIEMNEIQRQLAHNPPSMQDIHEMNELLGEEDDLPVPPNMPVFDEPKVQPTCPICFIELMTAESIMATKCGHVFCKNCILNSVKVKSNCPLCRKKVLKNQLLVIYLHG
ncbi:hypothetical protein R5R35_010975 [Gryllus longicercus]|uniref:RING-type domain-containing protein n=1 Tax=Gryllus longicercus TaxID=2509291 RepID=A0AAN9VP24_9ORTH